LNVGVALFAVLQLASAQGDVRGGNEPLSEHDQRTLRATAEELRAAILREDVEGVLANINREHGLTCTDTLVPYQQVRKDLHNRSSNLYLSLFDTARFSRRCGSEYPSEYPAISDKEFFSKATNGTIEIAPIEKNWAKVTFRSRVTGHYPREWTFHKTARGWRVTDGFIVGRCSCG